jgi:uncharacterized delta-60 repeat protein
MVVFQKNPAMKFAYFLSVSCSLLLSSALLAQSEGVLDPTFGVGGKKTISYLDYEFWVQDVALIQDGKLTLAGYVKGNGKDPFVLRLLSDGNNDLSFGTNGFVIFDYTGADRDNRIWDLHVQADGKIVGIGVHQSSAPNDYNPFLVRLNTSGSFDPTFGTYGFANNGTEDFEFMNGGSVAPSGKFVMAGAFYNPVTQENFPILSRSIASGLLDEDFNNGFSYLSGIEGQLFMAIADEEENVYGVGHQNGNLLLVKVNANGDLDTDFGTDGATVMDISNQFDLGMDLIMSQDQHLLLCGESGKDILIAKVNRFTGALMSDFGENGVWKMDVFDDNSYDYASDIKQLSDGTILVTGTSQRTYTNRDVVVVKLLEDGSSDPGWGTNGIVFYDKNDEFGVASTVQEDGKIITIGKNVNNTIIALRYENQFVTTGTNDLIDPNHSLQVFPNPAINHQLRLQYELKTPSDIQVALYDNQGRLLSILLETDRFSGQQEELLSLPAFLSKGVYQIRLTSNDGSSVRSLIIQ